MNTHAEINMYSSNYSRVIVFGGILSGKMAAFEDTPAWAEAYELARRLGVEITPLYGYGGSLAQ
jgi:hypothetical protein